MDALAIAISILEDPYIAQGEAKTVFLLGFFLLICEASMTHIGLVWITEKMESAPSDWFLWAASFGLSTYNIFSKWAFLGSTQEPERTRTALTEAVESLA